MKTGGRYSPASGLHFHFRYIAPVVMKYIAVLLCCLPFTVCAQSTDTTRMLNEAVVSGYTTARSSLNIIPCSLAKMDEKAPFNLADALAQLPGISQMSTGNSISKPVIRGLYGNRILVLYGGMRFDNQQWQDEHGLGLSQIGLEKVEVIKGPASLLYGSDAMGGVINVIEEKPSGEGKKLDIGTQLFSNTLGTLSDIGYSKKHNDRWFRIRLGFENHGDYSDGNGTRVLNSRNQGYYLKAGFGFQKKNWIQENTYNFSLNQFGFIMPDLGASFQPDARWSRAMNGPHHIVILNLANSQNTFLLKKSVLKLNAGIQSNIRMEDEGGGQISLNMRLLSGLQSLRWEKPLSSKVTFVGNQQLTYESNTNYGGRIIIPDASFLEFNMSGYFRFLLNKVIVELGAGASDKYIHTIATRSLNSQPTDQVQPFTRSDVTGNGMLGIVYNLTDKLVLKWNTASGSRSPNLAELSSNGLHEGVYRYEIGDPNLKIEKNVNSDFSILASGKAWAFSASAYYDRFFNYVYLWATGQNFFGFPQFRYRQQDALIYGSEWLLTVEPEGMKGWRFSECFTTTYGELDSGGYLPFIPANRSKTSVRYEKSMHGKLKSLFAEPEFEYVLAQDRAAVFETSTGDYALINFYAGAVVAGRSGDWRLGLAGTNLANRLYADHLSRLKYYGLYNQGLNIVFSLRKEIKW